MMGKVDLDSPITELVLVGAAYANKLEKLAIRTVGDLLWHVPSRYKDWRLISDIGRVQAGETVTIQGEIKEFKNQFTKWGKNFQKAIVADNSGEIEVIWFNQSFLYRVIKKGMRLSLSGKADFDKSGKLALVSPEYEELKTQNTGTTQKPPGMPHGNNFKGMATPGVILSTIHTGRLVPVYHETRGVSSKWLRSRVKMAMGDIFPDLEDWLTGGIIKQYRLEKLKEALITAHFPSDLEEVEPAKRRLAFDELIWLHLETETRRKSWKKTNLAFKLKIDSIEMLEFLRRLPFELTKAQNRTTQEILRDLGEDKPMNRLLEGDVGSGKTVVAAIGAYATHLSGYQTAIMAPTEILAQQHYQTLKEMLEPFKAKVVLQTGRMKYVKKGKDDPFDVVVGTHALLTKMVDFDRLALVVIDEQHRFGVEQRAKLVKKGQAPHVLTMTATPIPRTVALTLYGDLDLSLLDEMPEGRKKVKTWVVPQKKREAAYEWIKERLKEKVKISDGRYGKNQAFVICPFIEVSETMTTVKAATEEFEKLSKEVFGNMRLGLLHGKMKGREKDEVIEKFREGKLDILVSTPVVEVGVDIPAASIMVIEAADRFGLAQLHQLRGRVGRAGQQAYCLLFAESGSKKAYARLKSLERCYSGMELAEIDLKYRGPGQIYGTAQHGFWDTKVADLSDVELVKQTKECAREVFNNMEKYPVLKERLKRRTMADVGPN